MDDRLLRRAVEVNWRNLALGHEVFEQAGATFVRNRSLPQIYDANFVFGITTSEPREAADLLARVAREYAHAARLTFRIGPFTPPVVEARLALDGYSRTDALLLLLEGPLHGPAKPVEIRPVEDEMTWRAYAEVKRLDWREHATRINEDPNDETVPHGLALSNRLKCPPVRYVLAYQDGRPIGHCSAWEGQDGVGQVEDLFVHPAYRHRGIATALLHACVTAARDGGTGPVVIVTDPTDTPKTMYEQLGWSPIAMCRQYDKKASI